MAISLPKAKSKPLLFLPLLFLFLAASALGYSFYSQRQYQTQIAKRQTQIDELNSKITLLDQELTALKEEDQRKRNAELQKEIQAIQKTYGTAVDAYENLLRLKDVSTAKHTNLDNLFAQALDLLSQRNYTDAAKVLAELNTEAIRILTTPTPTPTPKPGQVPPPAPASNTPPGSGYSRQSVSALGANYTVSLVAADLSSTRIIVDTASDSDCRDNCPVLPLATYVSRNGGFAGINGTYFCPASYPTCAGKTNTFDLLVMNKNKTYFNSDNNVYSNNPVVVFGSGYIRFIGAASGWGRDTSPDGVLSNYPLLISGNNVVYGGDGDPKSGAKGGRSFVANKGNTVYIGVVHSATIAESANVLKALGMENALNLDDGGSTALYSGGYKLGPGRDLPNAIVFIAR